MSRIHRLVLAAALAAFAAPTVTAQKPQGQTAPEAFTSTVQAPTRTGPVSANLRVQIQRYTPEFDLNAMTDALKYGGYPAFLQALRRAPDVGQVALGDQTFTVRWARTRPLEKGRAISLVTDKPIYFVRGQSDEARPRGGFELALIEMTVDDDGMGAGTMAAAARVKPDGQGGVIIDDYADEPIKLSSIHRVAP